MCVGVCVFGGEREEGVDEGRRHGWTNVCFGWIYPWVDGGCAGLAGGKGTVHGGIITSSHQHNPFV